MIQKQETFKPESVDCHTYRQLKTYSLSEETHKKLLWLANDYALITSNM